VEHVTIVGGSVAGLRAAQELRRAGFAGRVTMVGAESRTAYQRPPLSKGFLSGAAEESSLTLRQAEGMEIEQILGVAATGLDPRSREVRLSSGERLAYDGLVIATGALPRFPAHWKRLPDVHTLRTVDDALALRHAFASGPRVAIVGAGFIGLEVAAAAREHGLSVTVIESLRTPLRGALGPEIGRLLLDQHEEHGVRFQLGTPVEDFVGDRTGVGSVRLADGADVPADVVVVGVGVTPCTGWLDDSGLPLADGLICDRQCAVEGWPDIVAAGDVARWWHVRLGCRLRVEHWDNAVLQGIHAAQRLLRGATVGAYDPTPSFWSDQYETKYQFVGVSTGADGVSILEGDVGTRRFAAGYHRRERLIGVLLANLPHRAPHYRGQLSAVSGDPCRDELQEEAAV
jgi:NADPH-dependent 2,4-dienoyl-CoA reductase/sulfur reductase-like enzyme